MAIIRVTDNKPAVPSGNLPEQRSGRLAPTSAASNSPFDDTFAETGHGINMLPAEVQDALRKHLPEFPAGVVTFSVEPIVEAGVETSSAWLLGPMGLLRIVAHRMSPQAPWTVDINTWEFSEHAEWQTTSGYGAMRQLQAPSAGAGPEEQYLRHEALLPHAVIERLEYEVPFSRDVYTHADYVREIFPKAGIVKETLFCVRTLNSRTVGVYAERETNIPRGAENDAQVLDHHIGQSAWNVRIISSPVREARHVTIIVESATQRAVGREQRQAVAAPAAAALPAGKPSTNKEGLFARIERWLDS